MSELPETTANVSEVIPLRPVEHEPSSWRFAGLPIEKALAVAKKYLAPVDYEMYLQPFLGEMKLISSIARDLAVDPSDVEHRLRELEVKVAEAHLANIPQGYGHAAAILTIIADKDSA